MKRNVKFWTRYTLECMELSLIAAAVPALLTIFSADGIDWGLFASMTPYLLCLGAVFSMMMINTGSQSVYVPLLISMGEPRRNVLLGFHYYRALITAVTVALCALIWLLVPGEMSATGLRSIPTLLCVLVSAASYGSILGTIYVKWKWVGLFIIIVMCGGMGGVIGITGASMANGSLVSTAMKIIAIFTHLPWWLVAVTLGLLVLDVIFQWMLLRRREVKF